MAPHRTRSSWTMLNPKSFFHTATLMGLVAVLSYLIAKLGVALVLRPQMLWPLWPGCAFLVAVLLLVPRKVWPILIAAGLTGFVVYDLQVGLTLRPIALLILGDTVEVLVAAVGLSYAFHGLPVLNSIKSLVRYSFFAVILAPLAAVFITTNAFGGDYWIRWRIGFFTEALALLTLTPAILTWVSTRRAWMRRSRAFYVEAAAQIATFSFLGYLAFIAPGPHTPALLYSLLPFLLWSALRFGVWGISTSMIVLAFVSIWGAVHGRGPFLESSPLHNVLSLQLFLSFAAATFMVLAALAEEQKQSERAFRESEKRFRLVADTAPALIWMSGTDKLCTYFNKPWLNFTGRSIALELGDGWAEGVHPEDLQRCVDTYTEAFERREQFRREYRLRRQDGEYRWVLDIGVPRFDEDRSFIGYIGCGVDVSERKHAEQALAKSEERFSKAFRQSPMILTLSTAKDNRYIDVNETFERVTGWHPDEVIGRTAFELGLWVEPTEGLEVMERILVEGSLRGVEARFCMKDGSIRTGEVSAELIELDGQPCALGVIADITERKNAEEALSTVSHRLIDAQEQERARIARELHDDIGQRLALLAVELDQIHQESPNFSEVRSRMGELHKQVSEIAIDIQTLSRELHSSKLEYLGLAAAVRGFCHDFGRQQQVEIDFKTHDLPALLPPDISLCLFRVLQEAVHNSVKHSGVRHIEVGLWGTLGEIHLTVSDSGAGFDSEPAKQTRGLGLVSMEERLKLLNGALSIQSQRNRGTTVHARIPYNSRNDSIRAAV